jgi:hypothetical protein
MATSFRAEQPPQMVWRTSDLTESTLTLWATTSTNWPLTGAAGGGWDFGYRQIGNGRNELTACGSNGSTGDGHGD